MAKLAYRLTRRSRSALCAAEFPQRRGGLVKAFTGSSQDAYVPSRFYVAPDAVKDSVGVCAAGGGGFRAIFAASRADVWRAYHLLFSTLAIKAEHNIGGVPCNCKLWKRFVARGRPVLLLDAGSR
jgi:hypothetical protein